jgi:hypothetical protein
MPDALQAIADVGPGATTRVDGGVLWVTTTERAVAIAPDHDRVTFDLTDPDLSLCVGDCSAAAASNFLEERTTPPTTAPPPTGVVAPTTTTAPPRRLDPAAVVTPTLPTTSTTARPGGATPTTSTTAPEASPTTVEPTASTAVVAPATSVLPAATAPPTTDDGKPGHGPDRPPKEDPTPTSTRFTLLPPLTTQPTTTSEPPSTDTSDTSDTTDTTEAATTTTDPASAPGLELDLAVRPGEATVSLRVLARPADCAADGTSTVATLLWQGATTGSRQVLVTWSNRGARESNVATATIPSPAGSLTVSVVVCEVTASRTATVPPDPSTTTTTTPPPSTTTTTTPPPSTTTTTAP